MHFPDLLVLGATGRLGGMLARHWPAPGAGLRRAGRRAGPGIVALDPLGDPAGLARAAEGAGAILCLAGVTPAAAARGAAMEDNARLALAAVAAGAETGAAVLLASSAAVYGPRGGLLAEDLPSAPVSDYGRAKAAMEAAALEAGARAGVRVCALRIGNVAGADAALGGWAPGFALDVFADGRTPRRSYVGPVTLARVLAALAARADALPGVLNIAAPGAVEMGALLDAAGLAWTPRPAPASAIAEVQLSTARLASLVPLDAESGSARALVAEWRADRAAAGLGACTRSGEATQGRP